MAEIYAYFSIYGDNFQPESITNILNIAPTESHMKNEVIPPRENLVRTKKIRYKETDWCLKADKIETADINESLKELTGELFAKAKELQSIRKKYDVKMLFMFVIYAQKDEMPAIYFLEDFTKFVGCIGAEIGFDIYC
jgi:hypothetical protein